MSEFRFPPLAAALIAGLCFAFAPSADAQLVRVSPLGGVNIRLLFVSVDTLPFGGGTRVRAPFTSVNTGLYGFGGPEYGSHWGGPRVGAFIPRGYHASPEPYVYADPFLGVEPMYRVPVYPVPVEPLLVPVPFYPSPNAYQDGRFDGPRFQPRDNRSYETARPEYSNPRLSPPPYQTPYQAPVDSVTETSLKLRQAAARFDRAIASRADDAEVWQTYLAPQEIVAMIDGTATMDMTRIQTLSQNYEGVAGNPDLSDIWVLDGFRQTHQGLKSWLAMQGGSNDMNQTNWDQNVSSGQSIISTDSLGSSPSVAEPLASSEDPESNGEAPAGSSGETSDEQTAVEDLPLGNAELNSQSPGPANEPRPFEAPARAQGAL